MLLVKNGVCKLYELMEVCKTNAFQVFISLVHISETYVERAFLQFSSDPCVLLDDSMPGSSINLEKLETMNDVHVRYMHHARFRELRNYLAKTRLQGSGGGSGETLSPEQSLPEEHRVPDNLISKLAAIESVNFLISSILRLKQGMQLCIQGNTYQEEYLVKYLATLEQVNTQFRCYLCAEVVTSLVGP